jgi:hypothetical protein
VQPKGIAGADIHGGVLSYTPKVPLTERTNKRALDGEEIEEDDENEENEE